MKFIAITIFAFFFSFNILFAQDENKPNVYNVQILLSVECIGGWEADCSMPDERYFKTVVNNNTYNFSNSIGFGYTNGVNFVDHVRHEIPKTYAVRQRFIMAYASRVSETEGVVFCDTLLPQLKKSDKSWYAYTKFYPLMTDTAGFYIINDQVPPYGTYKNPRIGAVIAKQIIAKDHASLFETGTDEELRENREVKVWPYAIELEFTSTYKGKSAVYKFRFRIRHGEC